MRELCAGVNIDPGTAAAFRAGMLPAESNDRRPVTLVTTQSPGDAVAMTAAVYSLHRAHPGKFLTGVRCFWPEVFEHNPDVVDCGGPPLYMHYPAIHKSNDRGIHFMQAWCEHLGSALGVNVPLLTNRPRLYFADPQPSVEGFWLVCSGGKKDFTNKLWPGYQGVVDALRGAVQFVQVGVDQEPLNGAECAVGRTSLRGLFELARRARGVLCGVSLLMHVAAALEKPAVVVAGGREPVQWNAYPRQHYLHTVGVLPCRDLQGHVGEACWRSRVVPLGDGTVFDKSPCERPRGGYPECMHLIRPEAVASKVLQIDSNL